METVSFHFDEILAGFLPRPLRGQPVTLPVTAASVKHQIETLGVPHTEVERLLVNGRPVGFTERLQAGDRVEVHSRSGEGSRLLREALPEALCFIADVHLGGLAQRLRMAGFDTLFADGIADRDIAARAAAEARIVLTRDRDLLMHRLITHGCYIHTLAPAAQFPELVRRLGLAPHFRPFTRCLACNLPLEPASGQAVLAGLPPSVRADHHCFTQCPRCRRVFWKGSHWRRMCRMLEEAAGGV